MQLWALYWHLRTLSDQPMVIVGLAARFLPVILFSLIAGVAADRFNRRKIAILTQLALGLVAMVIGLSTWLVCHHLAVIRPDGFQSVAAAFDTPARRL
jgi:MFS family permease